MTNEDIKWPVKTREFQSHHFDSTIWNDFNLDIPTERCQDNQHVEEQPSEPRNGR